MHCPKYNKNVIVKDCEDCISNRACDPVCVKREFIWGVKDEEEPRWVHSWDKAAKMKTDVSYFFDPKWEGNSHLIQKVSISTTIRTKAPIPQHIRWEVWERDNFTCKHCGTRRKLSIDHIHPESAGGETVLDNLQTLCMTCNSKKGSRTEQLSRYL